MSVTINPYTTLTTPKPADAAKAADTAKGAGTGGNPVADGISEFKQAMEAAEQAAVKTAVTGADPHAMVEALANAEMMLDTAVTIRDKVVEAYQELLRMPV
ncbi:MAG: flagellar hook-basal body complex protein FliE [Hyphomonadaceae bacterium]|nr:flagellar hook-basal body complex protein FliE [Hyphomonadaceae bacterium]